FAPCHAVGRKHMANIARPLQLSEDERQALVGLQRAPSVPAGGARRARAVLLMADAVPGVEVARLTGYTTVQVSRIRQRFCQDRLAGLEDRPRSGRPPTVTQRTTARIVALTLKPPPAGLTHWSTRDLADTIRRRVAHDGPPDLAGPRTATASRRNV